MKTQVTLLSVTIISIVLLQSCFSSKNILKLQPESKDSGKWLYGQQFITDSIDGIIYEVGFERCQNEQYWFDFTITNKSNMPILIDPSNFKIQGYNGYKKPLLEKKVSALNPENEILKLEKSLAKADAFEANSLGLSLLAASIDVTTGVVTATDDNPNNDFLSTNFLEGVQEGRESNAYHVQNALEVKDAWESSTIRKTTLETNYKIQGKVFFPAFREASFVKLFLPIDSNYLELNYEQLQIPVN